MHSHTIKVLTRLLLVNCRGIRVRVPMLSPLAGSWSGLDRFAFILGETVCNNSLHLVGEWGRVNAFTLGQTSYIR